MPATHRAAAMTPADLRAWMQEAGLDPDRTADVVALAEDVGLSRRTMYNYLAGAQAIPRVFALALEGLAARRRAG